MRGHFQKHTQETKDKISLAKKGKPSRNKGIPNYKLRGKNNPAKRPEIRIKISQNRSAVGNKSGEEASNWRGGFSLLSGYKSFIHKKYHLRKKNNGGSHTFGDWQNLKAQYNWTCPACGKSEPEIKLTEDHIIPVSKGGSDNLENIQPLCLRCNCIKHSKIIEKYKIKT